MAIKQLEHDFEIAPAIGMFLHQVYGDSNDAVFDTRFRESDQVTDFHLSQSLPLHRSAQYRRHPTKP
jgi:hypothetical protein